MGIFAVLLSAVFSTSKDILSKKLAVRIDGLASTFASFAFAVPFYVAVLASLWLLGHDIFTFSVSFWWLVVARAVTDVFAEGMKMYAFVHGDISLVSILFSFSPLFVLMLSSVMTNDSLSVGGALAVLLVVVGSVAVVYRPSHPDFAKQKKAMLLAIGASIFFALNSIYDRLAVGEHSQQAEPVPDNWHLTADNWHLTTAFLVKPAVAGFTMTALSALLLLPFVLFHKDRLAGLYGYRRGLSARGLLEVAFMVSKLVGMKWLAAPYVVGLQRSSLLLSIIAGRVIFKEADFLRRLIAGLLILAGVIWILWEQAR
jgi:drug/metabolite transporter (DMT)-like permease